MRFRIVENQAYHYGDLDVAKKTDVGIMGGRGTGHFGSGFYLIGKYDPDNAYDYAKRAHWEVDLSAYNLYRPRSNSDGYKLHDALRTMNNMSPNSITPIEHSYEYVTKVRNLIYDQWDFLSNLGEIYFADVFDDNGYHSYSSLILDEYNDGKLDDDFAKQITDYNENLINEIKSIYGSLKLRFPEDSVRDEVYGTGRFDTEEALKDSIESHNRQARYFREAVFDLYLLVGLRNGVSEEKLSRICVDAINQTHGYDFYSKEDSTSTLIMKALGYDGVDVTHLDHDDEGLRGLDNFTYGSVIYDLKPGTFKKIKEKSN